MSAQSLLALLIGAALAAAGWLQGWQWRQAASASDRAELEEELELTRNEVEILERENEALRSLAQGGGEVPVTPELLDFVADAIGLDFLSSPVVHRIAGEALRDRVVASLESRLPPNGLGHREQAWRLLGLLGPNDNFAPQMAATRSLGARSWFDPQSGEAWVTDRFDEDAIPDQAALVRALTRVLIHQHYPPPPGYPGDEPARAAEALRQGAAVAVETRFLARQAVGIGFTGSQVDSGAGDLLAALPVFVQGLATFPARQGTPRATRLMDQEELLGALHDPPQRTAWFFDEGLSAIEPPPLPESAAEEVLVESAGMLGLRLWLAGIDPELAELARHWRGDHYRLGARGDAELELHWAIACADAESAAELEAAARQVVATLEELAAPLPDAARRLAVSREGAVLRFSNLGG